MGTRSQIIQFSKYWLPVFVWMALIFTASTDVMSGEHTSRFLEPFLRWLAPNISAATIAMIHVFFRKCAHLAGYAILGALLWRAIRWQLPTSHNNLWRVAAIALVITASYASLDEFHQSFVPSRTASVYDVLLDCCGAMLALAICRFKCS